jgi:hypothetical protein
MQREERNESSGRRQRSAGQHRDAVRQVEDALGGSATFFSAAASLYCGVQLVGVVGSDFPVEQLDSSGARRGPGGPRARCEGESFRWSGVYSYDLNSRETLETRLGRVRRLPAEDPGAFRDAEWIFLATSIRCCSWTCWRQVRRRAGRVRHHELLDRGKRDDLLRLLERVDLLMVNDSEARELSGDHNLLRRRAGSRRAARTWWSSRRASTAPSCSPATSSFFAPGYPAGGGVRSDGRRRRVRRRLHRLPGARRPRRRDTCARHDLRLGHGLVRGGAVRRRPVPRAHARDMHDRVCQFRELTAFEQPILGGSHV